MSARFEELDRRDTPIGEISVRRRLEPTLLVDVYEVKLGDEFLMSSLFTVAEIALARLGLAAVAAVDDGDDYGDGDGDWDGDDDGDGDGDGRDSGHGGWDVVVGGLGLGYTARAVLEDPRVRSLHVVEALGAVIEWHERHLLPMADLLTADPRCHLLEGDFFAWVASNAPLGVTAASGADAPFLPDASSDADAPFGADTTSDADAPARWHAVLVDIDHSPRHLLHPSHATFYEPDGLAQLAARLHPGGVFGLWADGAPDDAFVGTAERVFASCTAHVVTFPNHYTGGESASTVYVAVTGT